MVTDRQPLVCLMDQEVVTQIQTRWLRLGLFQSIRPTIKYQPRKVNVVAGALSRSQRKEVAGSIDDLAANAPTEEEQLLTLSGFSMELLAEEFQQWTEDSKEDKGCCALCLGAVDWHNCGRVLGAWEFGWDCFVQLLYLLCVQYCGLLGGPSIIVCNGPTSWQCSLGLYV